jgi:hypothetical protein
MQAMTLTPPPHLGQGAALSSFRDRNSESERAQKAAG